MVVGGEIIWNMVYYDVQLIGGMVLYDGKVVEMVIGEGKIFVVIFLAYFNGLFGQGVYVIIVNDYFVCCDQEWVGFIFEFLFFIVDCIDKYCLYFDECIKVYKCDIIYGINNEFGFDYLWDNMVCFIDEKVQGKYYFVMIDEVDFVLIDDVWIFLIIFGLVFQGSEDQEYVSLCFFVEKFIVVQCKLVMEYFVEAKCLFKEGKLGYQEGEVGMVFLCVYCVLLKYCLLIKFLSEDGVKVVM